MNSARQHRGRGVHLVGSIPAQNAEQAMQEAVTRLGNRLSTLPDGETGDRRDWIVSTVRALRTHPDLEVSRDGDFSDYRHALNFRVRRNHTLRGQTLDLGYLSGYERSIEEFHLVERDSGLRGLTFQVGIAGDLDMAMMAMGPTRMFAHRKAFRDATVAEIDQIRERATVPVLFQLELPCELVMVAQTPRPFRPLVAAALAKGVARIAEQVRPGTRFGIHLCLGDLGHRAFGTLRDAAPLVLLANAIVRAWPWTRPLEYVHAPFAAGERPAPLEPAFYRPLSALRLPSGVRFVAGFVHEARDLAEHHRILRMIEKQWGRQVDVAAACGLGRRTPAVACHTMDLAAQVASLDDPPEAENGILTGSTTRSGEKSG